LKRRTEKHFLGPGSETCSKKLTHNLVSSVWPAVQDCQTI
jgi:hypothetical protein